MEGYDLILNSSHEPSFEEIDRYIEGNGNTLWKDIITFLQQRYNAPYKITYSKCSGKLGWNVKYQKSGKSLCTLYPEKDSYIALIVITLDLVPAVEALSDEFDQVVIDIIKSTKPFNGTLWLMIRVDSKKILDNVKQLLLLKYSPKS